MPLWLCTDPQDLCRISVNTVLGVCAYGYLWVCTPCICNFVMCSWVLIHIFAFLSISCNKNLRRETARLCVHFYGIPFAEPKKPPASKHTCPPAAPERNKTKQKKEKKEKKSFSLHSGFIQAPFTSLWSFNLYVSFTVFLITFPLSLSLSAPISALPESYWKMTLTSITEAPATIIHFEKPEWHWNVFKCRNLTFKVIWFLSIYYRLKFSCL